MTCRRHQFSTREAFTQTIDKGSLSIALCKESDPGDISSTFYFNASSTVRKQNCHSNRIADSTTLVTVDGTDDRAHVFQSLIIGGPGTYVPFPSHSFLAPIGATAWILMLDCRWVNYNSRRDGFLIPLRAERKLGQVCSEEQYTKVFDRLNLLPSRVEHLIIQLGDASSSLIVTARETEYLHRDSDCLSPHGILGARVVVKIQSCRCIGEVGY
jgi:hypothetical protein